MHENADQLVLEYLRRVGDVAHGTLRSDDRLDFMTRLRWRIDEMRAEAGAVGPEQVRKVIARFGDPSQLVTREQDRLERVRAAAATAEEPAQDAPPAPEAPPLQNGRAATAEQTLDSESSTQPIPAIRSSTPPPWARQGRGEQAAPADGREVTEAAPEDGSNGPTIGSRQANTSARPGYEGPPRYDEKRRVFPGMAGLGETMSSIDLPALMNGHRLGTATIALLGLGALIAPFPYTLIPLAMGAVCLAFARTWPARDKLVGVGTPLAGLMLGVFVLGSATRNEQVVLDVAAYTTAFTGYGMVFVRVGALIGACYLAFQLLRRTVGTGSAS